MSTVPTLSTMPDVVLKLITKDFDLMEIQILRKVCRHLRSFIDSIQLDSNIHSIFIWEDGPNAFNQFRFDGSQKMIYIKYHNYQNGCLIEYENKKKYLENQDFASLAGNDLGLVLQHQKTTLDYFSIGFRSHSKSKLSSDECSETPEERFLSNLERNLMNRKLLLPVDEIYFKNTHQQAQVLKILPYLKSGTLTNIKINNFEMCGKDSNYTFKMDKIVELEQWKKTEFTAIYRMTVTSSWKDFMHFDMAYFKIEEIATEDLILLRETILKRDPVGKHSFDFTYLHFSDEQDFIKLFGKPLSISKDILVWYYRFPNSDRALKFSWNEKNKYFQTRSMLADNAPNGAFD